MAHQDCFNDIEEYRTIESNDAAVRKEEIRKESMHIRKKWENMDQKQIERKLWLEYEAYQHNKRFEQFEDDEKDIIFAMS
jgi:hypothetical protein